MRKLRLFFTYLGGKYRIADRYPAPRHDVIVEPFAGSAGYSTNYHERQVILIERNPRIAGIWRYLLSATPADVLALPLIGDGWRTTDDLAHLPAGARDLIGMWLSKATTAPRVTPSRWAIERPDASYWGERVRGRIAEQLDSIRHWVVVEESYEWARNGVATWFVDPPYVGAGHQYPNGSRDLDYAALAEWCRSRHGQTIVCEGADATWLPFRPIGTAKGQRAGSVECVWINDDC